MKIWKIVRENFKIIIVLCIVSLISNFTKIVSPYMLQRIIENFDNFAYYLLCFFFLLFISYSGQFLFEYLVKCFSVTFQTSENVKIANLIYSMRYEDIEKNEPTYLADRQDEAVAYMFSLVSTNLSDIIGGFISVVFIIILMVKYNYILALCYAVYAVISFVGYKYINKSLLEKSMKVQETVSTNFKNILSFMTNTNFLKMLSDFKMIGRHLEKLYKSTAEENANVGFFAAGIGIILDFVLEIMQNTIYIITFYLVFVDKIQYSQVAVVVLLNNIFRTSMETVNTTNIGLRDVKASINFINDTILGHQEQDKGSVIINNISSIQVCAKDIGYDDNIYIESGTLAARCGDIVGISGPSGIGKSTFIKVLLGLKDDSLSNISYNGNNIHSVIKSSIKENVRYISQTKSVFPVSLKENLLLGMPEEKKESEETLAAVNELLNEPWFAKFADLEIGLDTMILEGGANLSGGDQQKISIVRILLNPPDLLILDEFSNSIDKEAEQQIMKKIKEKFNDKIVILITHDEELLKWCNKVYTINNKQIVQKL